MQMLHVIDVNAMRWCVRLKMDFVRSRHKFNQQRLWDVVYLYSERGAKHTKKKVSSPFMDTIFLPLGYHSNFHTALGKKLNRDVLNISIGRRRVVEKSFQRPTYSYATGTR
jgi:hypothetical protein